MAHPWDVLIGRRRGNEFLLMSKCHFLVWFLCEIHVLFGFGFLIVELERNTMPFQVKTVKVSNVSLGASERDLKEFFSFSGDIEYVEMMRFAFSDKPFSIVVTHTVTCHMTLTQHTSLAVTLSGLKLHMLPSRMPKEQIPQSSSR